MVAVVAVALILSAEVTRRRWVDFRRRARENDAAEMFDRLLLAGGSVARPSKDGRAELIRGPKIIRWNGLELERPSTPGYDAESLRRRAEYHARLKEKYRRTAAFPWLPVEPDPPEP
jgi:hypothetical protein